MARKLVLVLFVLLVAVLAGCGPSDGGTVSEVAPTSTPTVKTGVDPVDNTVTTLTEAVATGPACAYGLAISNDIAHRLNHYRICMPESGQEQKQADALQKAVDDCCELCDFSFPDEAGNKTQSNLDCVAQCKGE